MNDHSGAMNLFSVPHFEVQKAILSLSLITKNMVDTYAFSAPDFLAYPQGKEPDSGQWKKNGLATNN